MRTTAGQNRPVAHRILVAGPSGSGKTTLARRIGAVTGLPHTEIDAVHWRAGWTANPRFAADVADLAAGEHWVTEFQYREALPILAARADLPVHLRPLRAVVLLRVIRRTLRRRLRGELLWGVNREPRLRSVLTDRDHIVRWSMRTFAWPYDRVAAAQVTNPALHVVTVRTRSDVERLLRQLAPVPR